MPEILVVTVKRHPDLSALFVNGVLVYYSDHFRQPKATAVAYNLAKALHMKGAGFRSVNIPYKHGMTFDARTYLQAKRYLSYRDRATERKRLRRVEQLTLVG